METNSSLQSSQKHTNWLYHDQKKSSPHLIYIRKVLISNLIPDAGYPDRLFRGFPQPLRVNTLTVP